MQGGVAAVDENMAGVVEGPDAPTAVPQYNLIFSAVAQRNR